MRLVKSYLERTEIIKYTDYIFSNTFKKIYNYCVIPRNKRFSEISLINNEDKNNEKDLFTVDEIIEFCDELINAIVGSIISMPRSLRYFIKLLEVVTIEAVK